MNPHEKAADLLLKARIESKRMDLLPEDCRPARPDDGYQVQHLLIDRYLEHYGGRTLGYKVACTNKLPQELLGTDEPFYGRLVSPFVRSMPVTIDRNDYLLCILEPEFGFEMAADLPPSGAPYDKDAVFEAIGAIMPGVEVVDSRFTEWTKVDLPSLIADNACNAGWVRGEAVSDWKDIDLAGHEVTLYANGKIIRQGTGDAVLGHPINVMTWLANILCRHGGGLKAGDLVTTGTVVDVYQANPGDEVIADFGRFGRVEMSFKSP